MLLVCFFISIKVISTGLLNIHINKGLKGGLKNQAGRGAFARRTRSVAFLHEYRTGDATTTCEGYLNRTFNIHINKGLKGGLREQAGRGAFARRTRSVAFLHEYRTGDATTTCEGYLNRTFNILY